VAGKVREFTSLTKIRASADRCVSCAQRQIAERPIAARIKPMPILIAFMDAHPAEALPLYSYGFVCRVRKTTDCLAVSHIVLATQRLSWIWQCILRAVLGVVNTGNADLRPHSGHDVNCHPEPGPHFGTSVRDLLFLGLCIVRTETNSGFLVVQNGMTMFVFALK
jgi:hypothetical protein